MIIGIILAAGKGKRFNCAAVNKTALDFNHKALVKYGVDLFNGITDKTFIVVGAFADSVKQALAKTTVGFIEQKQRLGTGHAVKVALKTINQQSPKPKLVLVGYADHMMFYPQKIVKNLIQLHQKTKTAVSLISSRYHDPDALACGRIIRTKDGLVDRIVEHKDATDKERRIKELNAGFYCFDYNFLNNHIKQIKPSPTSGEYYLPDMVAIARQKGLSVAALQVRFRYVGIGINTPKQFKQSQQLYRELHRS